MRLRNTGPGTLAVVSSGTAQATLILVPVNDFAALGRRYGAHDGAGAILDHAHGSIGKKPVAATGMHAPEVVERTWILDHVRPVERRIGAGLAVEPRGVEEAVRRWLPALIV